MVTGNNRCEAHADKRLSKVQKCSYTRQLNDWSRSNKLTSEDCSFYIKVKLISFSFLRRNIYTNVHFTYKQC